MNAQKVLDYLDQQKQAIAALIDELDEVQVAFNAQFDAFKADHDRTLDKLSEEVFARLQDDSGALAADLVSAIADQAETERTRLEERRSKVRDEYLPQRRQAADQLLAEAQAELAQLRALNPQLDQEEETLKRQKAALEGQLESLNREIGRKSRGLGVVTHFLAITRADRERHRVLGKLEVLGESLYAVRQRWNEERAKIEERQAAYQRNWQMESIATARLQAELDQLNDDVLREELALRRATRHVLDNLKTRQTGQDPELGRSLDQMVELNIRTDDYHEGLATVAGLIGLLRGMQSGLEAVGKSVEGLLHEQQMHSAYLKPLDFRLPETVETFHRQWPALRREFVDEEAVSTQPAEFAARVEPLLDGPLSEETIKAMFDALGSMIERAAAKW
ncbi:MAG: hypothetical protein ACK2UC_13600 [Anaerolineae bacterium]|jgi:hypothetical protein